MTPENFFEGKTLYVHVVVLFIYKQTDRQTDREIVCRCIDLVQSFNHLHGHLVYGDCFKIKMIILISYLRVRRFQWLKNEQVFLLSHLFAFNTLRIVYSMKKTPIIDCITHLLLMTLHSECCRIGHYPIRFTNVPMSSVNLIFVLSTICGNRAVEAISCVQKSKKHFTI